MMMVAKSVSLPKKPTRSTRLTPEQLAALSADQLVKQAAVLEAAMADLKRQKAAIKSQQDTLVREAQEKEEKRLGKLAYAAGLGGVDAGVLEKEFALVRERVPVVTLDAEKEAVSCAS